MNTKLSCNIILLVQFSATESALNNQITQIVAEQTLG